MKYSRIYQYTRNNSDQALSLSMAAPGSNDDEIHYGLFDLLRTIFHTHARKQLGFFDPEINDAILPQMIGEYYQQTIDADNLGMNIANQFKNFMQAQEQQTTGYLWFVIEQNSEEEFLYLFFLKADEIHRISSKITISLGVNIDPARLQYAAKFNLREWKNQQSKTYITFLTAKNQQPITVAWNALIGFSAGIDKVEQTETFLNVVERFAEALPPEKELDYRARVIDYCLDQDRIGEPVSVAALSRHVDDSAPEALLNFMTEHFEKPTPEIHPDRKQLKRYTRFYGRATDMTISFSTMLFGNHIIYDEGSDTLTIRAIPESLKSQLKQFLKKSG